MRNLNSFLPILVILLVLVGCKKDEDAEPDNLPVGITWKITQLVITTNLGTVDQIPTTATCDADDVFRFRDDATYVRDEGASKCNANDPQIVDQGTWSKDKDTFTWDGDNFTIEELNRQTFRIKASNSTGASVTITFTAQ
jgi:hypothetical protein